VNLKKNLNIFFCLCLFLNFLNAKELKHADVSFTAVGSPSFLRITGEASKLDYVVTTDKGGGKFEVFEFTLNELSTGIDLRDEHMKEKYLDVKEYPTAILKFRQQDKSILSFEDKKTLEGTLSLHGQTRAILIEAQKKGNRIQAYYEIKLSDFGIKIPEWAGVTIADKVSVQTSFDL